MPYHRTKGSRLQTSISSSLKEQILVAIGTAVINFRDTLVSFGYSLAQKAKNNKEAAKTLCAAAEVVYDGFKGTNDEMTAYQDNILKYSDTSLIIDIFDSLIRGVNISEDEENPRKLDCVEISGEISQIYSGHDDLCSYFRHD